MSLDQHRYYLATCDVALDRATGKPLIPQPGRDDLLAWSDAGGPEQGPLRDALGRLCPTTSGRVDAPSPQVARRTLMNAGWKIRPIGRRLPPKVACPDHREVDL